MSAPGIPAVLIVVLAGEVPWQAFAIERMTADECPPAWQTAPLSAVSR